jgi:hypothetical protein
MSITLELTPAEETRLRDAASVHNLDLPTFAKACLLGELEPEETAFLRAVGQAAIIEAREKLMAQGIGYVEGRNGKVIMERPGTAE